MKMWLTGIALAVASAMPASAATTVVSNTSAIPIIDESETTSSIVVSNVSGTLTGLSLSLFGLSHTYPDDIVLGLLNETAGVGFVFFSGVGGSTDVNNINLTFSDDAAGFAPESFFDGPLVSGTYLPSNYYEYEFTNFTNATSFGDFAGLAANGTWSLYVLDTFAGDEGTIAGGFSLTLVTDAGVVPEPATWAMMIGGFGAAGAAMRRRRHAVKVSYAA